MRVLLDECVPARLKAAFPEHAVRSVTETTFRGSKDKPLLESLQGRFDVFVTVDRNLEKQQDLRKYDFGFVIVGVPSNRLSAFQPILGELRRAIDEARPGKVLHVRSPRLPR